MKEAKLTDLTLRLLAIDLKKDLYRFKCYRTYSSIFERLHLWFDQTINLSDEFGNGRSARALAALLLAPTSLEGTKYYNKEDYLTNRIINLLGGD